VLLTSAGATAVSFSPGPLGLCRDVSERIVCSREPAEAAEELLHLLARRRFAWVILSDEVLLEALLAGGNAAALSGWFPFDPADRRVTDLLLSKHAFAERLKGLHIAIPASRFASSARQALAAAREFGYPVVVKGDRGFGGLEVRVAFDARDLQRAARELLRRYSRVLVQHFVAGARVSACALFARGELTAFKAYRAECAYPDERSASTEHAFFAHEALEPALRALGAATGFHGMAGVDFMYDHEHDALYAIEINPRPTIGFGGTAADREFFSPAIGRLLRGEQVTATAIYDGRERTQTYFPGHLFYLATNARSWNPQSAGRAVACLREARVQEWRLAIWEIARFFYDEARSRFPPARAIFSRVRRSAVVAPLATQVRDDVRIAPRESLVG